MKQRYYKHNIQNLYFEVAVATGVLNSPRVRNENISQFLTWRNTACSPDNNPYSSPLKFSGKHKIKNFRDFISESYQIKDSDTPDTVKGEEIGKLLKKGLVAFFVEKYEHGAITFFLHGEGIQCPFDTGIVGLMIVEEKNYKRLTGKTFKDGFGKVKEYLREELKDYSHYVNGECYIVNEYDDKGNLVAVSAPYDCFETDAIFNLFAEDEITYLGEYLCVEQAIFRNL